jgi:hypothetical protein
MCLEMQGRGLELLMLLKACKRCADPGHIAKDCRAKSSRNPDEGDTDQQVTGAVRVIADKIDAS